MLRDAVLDTVILFFVVQTNDCVVECLDASGCQQINVVEERINSLGVHLCFCVCFFLNINVKGAVASLQGGLYNLFKSPSLRSWMLRFLLSVLDLIDYLLFLLLRTGTPRARSCYFLLLRIIYEYYKARDVIDLFQLDESF